MPVNVASLFRYPVKSLQGERLETLELGPGGVLGDRRYGLLTPSGHVLSAKTEPVLLEAAARTEGDTVVVRLPDGRELDCADGPGTSEALSGWLGREVTLREAGPEVGDVGYEMTFDPPNDDAEVVTWPAMPGSFLDLAGVHLLTTASLAGMAALAPEVDWSVRRFRPNVLVDTGDAEGFVEDAWVGAPVGLGDAGARLQVDMTTIRCAMPLRAQPAHGEDAALDRDVRVFRALQEAKQNFLGLYCTVASPGPVRVGDAVRPGG